MLQSMLQKGPPVPLYPDQVKDAIKASEGNPKFTRHRDGGSLYLMTRNGRGYWLFMFRDGRSLRSKMLGSAANLSPNQARNARNAFNVKRLKDKADREAGKEPHDAENPRGVIALRKARAATGVALDKPFGDIVTEYLEGYWLPGRDGAEPAWMAGKAAADNWRGGLEGPEAKSYRRTLLGHDISKLPAAEIDTDDVQRHLALWADRPVTAKKVRTRIQAILENAKARGFRTGDNPASNEIFKHLPQPKAAKVESHPAMLSENVPALMHELITMGDPTARALAFLILTATRTDETRLARWSEIDIKHKLWIIPGERIKEGLEHRVPLSPAAIKLLGATGKPGEFVFPSPSKGAKHPIWDNGMNHLMKRLLRDGKISAVDGGRCPVPHGFRATFSGDWAAKNGYPLELREMALAHSVGDAVVKVYNRPQADLYKVRIPMMEKWSDFACAKL